MPSNKEQIERVTNLLEQAQAVLGKIDFAHQKMSDADHFIPTLMANVDNENLTDAEFRQFVRNSLPLGRAAPGRKLK